jgi:hypothetical protein
MVTYDWAPIRSNAIQAFGDAPHAELEQRIMDAFAENPQLVIKQIAQVTASYQAGKIRSPWAILDLNLKEANRPGTPLTATDTTAKLKTIARAEQWIRNTGAHYDRETEIVDELFGDRGLLKQYAAETSLVARMTALWEQCRPEGIRIEEEAIAAAEKWKEWKRNEAKAIAAKTQPPEDDLPF